MVVVELASVLVGPRGGWVIEVLLVGSVVPTEVLPDELQPATRTTRRATAVAARSG
jgi:hypothetical protein